MQNRRDIKKNLKEKKTQNRIIRQVNRYPDYYIYNDNGSAKIINKKNLAEFIALSREHVARELKKIYNK